MSPSSWATACWPTSAGRSARGRRRARGARRAASWSRRSRGWQPRAEVRLQARIGIATGQVVVGDLIGEGARDEEAVVGETPEPRGAPSGAGRAGQRGDRQATRRLVGGLVRARRPRAAAPQGLRRAARGLAGRGRGPRRGPVRSAADREPDAAGRPRRGAGAAAAPLAAGQGRRGPGGAAVGRARHRQVAPGARAARAARGRAAYRLLYQCSPHHTTSPLHPVIEQLERAAGFARDDPPRRGSTSSRRCWRAARQALPEVVPLIAALLGIPTGERYPALDLAPQRQKTTDAASAGRSARGAGGRAAGAARLRGRALDRPDHTGTSGPDDRAHPAPAGADA